MWKFTRAKCLETTIGLVNVDKSLKPMVGGFNPPPEKYESQIGSSSQLLGKIRNVPNHQPETNCDLKNNLYKPMIGF